MSFKNKRTNVGQDIRLPSSLVGKANEYLQVKATEDGYQTAAAIAAAGSYRGVTYLEDYGIDDQTSDFADELNNAFTNAPEGSVIIFPSGWDIFTSEPVIIPKAQKGLKIFQNGATLKAHASWDNGTVGGKGLYHFEGGSGAEDSWEHTDFVLQDAILHPNGKQARGISMEDFRHSGNEPDHIKGGIWINLKGEGAGSVAGYELLWAKGLENGNLFIGTKAEGWKVDGMAADPDDHATDTHCIIKIHESDNNGNWTWAGGKLSPATSGTNGGCMMMLLADPSPLNRDRIYWTHFFGRKGTFGITGLLEVWKDGGGRYNNRTHVRDGFSIEDCKIAWDIYSDSSSGARGYMTKSVGLENKNNGADFEADHRLLRINGNIQGDFSGCYMMNQGGDNNVWNYIENNSPDPITFYPSDIQMRSSANNAVMRILQGSAFGLPNRRMNFGGTDTIQTGRTGQFAASGGTKYISPFGDTAIDETTEDDVQMEIPFDDFIIREMYAKWDVNTLNTAFDLEFRIAKATKISVTVPAVAGRGSARTTNSGNVDYSNGLVAGDDVFVQNSLGSIRLPLTGSGNVRFTGIYVVLQKIGNIQRGTP